MTRPFSESTAASHFSKATVSSQNQSSSRSTTATTILVLVMACVITGRAWGGIGPENVIVVVNGDSRISRTLANHYTSLRQIAGKNVIVLSGIPDGLTMSLDDFKAKVLRPVLETLNTRGLAAQARVIAYSADFPTSVDIRSHLSEITDANIKKYQRPTASINGLTFFYRYVLADNSSYLNWTSNLYARGEFERHFANPFAGEKKATFAAAEARLAEDDPVEAAEIFATLFDEYPNLSPLAIRAAEAYASAEDDEQATEWLLKAITAGWWSKQYLTDSHYLQPLLDRPRIAAVMPRLTDSPITMQGPVGFSGTRGWTSSGHAVAPDQGGMPYLLSCMLGVVHPRGSSIEQAIEALGRAAPADRTYPTGKFGFSKTGDVRTKTRFPGFANAMLWLAQNGHEVEIFSSPLPEDAGVYSGLMLGTATMDPVGKPWRMTPGTIAESLTSTGGAFGTSSQTKLTELLHAGAAMSSGAVTEPYSLQFKFPLPMMHAYYSEGVSAIEAYYLSVASPYQLLIVGDPITQPYARPPNQFVQISRKQADANDVLIQRESLSSGVPHTKPQSLEIYIQDKLVRVSPPVQRVELNLPDSLSGTMNIRAVLVGIHPTEPRIGFSETIQLTGPLATPTARIVGGAERAHEPQTSVTVELACAGADRIELLHGDQQVGSTASGDSSSEVLVTAGDIGSGPVTLRPVAHFGDTEVFGKAIELILAP